jgi:hypothetical protein
LGKEKMNDSLRYYTPGQVALACFLGSPLAACWLMSRTYRAADEKKKERASIIWGSVGTVALLSLAFVLPDSVPHSALPMGVTIGLFQFAKQLQAPTIARCEAAGQTKGSWWMVVGVGVLCLLIVLAVVAAIVFSLPAE